MNEEQEKDAFDAAAQDDLLQEQIDDKEYAAALEADDDDDNEQDTGLIEQPSVDGKENTDASNASGENDTGEENGSAPDANSENASKTGEESGENSDGNDSSDSDGSGGDDDLESRAAKFAEKIPAASDSHESESNNDNSGENKDQNDNSGGEDNSGTAENNSEKSDSANNVNALDLSALPEELLNMKFEYDGNDDSTFKDFIDEYPELAKSQIVMINHMQKMQEQQFGEKHSKIMESYAEMQKTVESLQNNQQKLIEQNNHNYFLSEVRKVHSDVDQIIRSHEFKEWVEKQSPAVQNMATRSNDNQDGIAIITAYKNDMAKAAAKSSSSNGNNNARQTLDETGLTPGRQDIQPGQKDDFDDGYNHKDDEDD